MSGSPNFVRQLWGVVINRDRKSVLMSVVSRVINFRVIHGFWKLVYHHRLGGVTTNSACVGIGEAFGNPSMEAIMSCKFPRTLTTTWYKTSKLKIEGSPAFQEIYVKDGKRDKESMSIGGFISHIYPLCWIEGPFMFTWLKQTRRELGTKDWGQAYNQPE